MTARWLGWIGVLSLCALGLGLGWRRRPQPHAAALVAFGVFVLGMVLLTGAGRLRFGIASALANRYATPALLFWAVLFLLAAARVAAVPRSLWRRPAGMLLPAPALVLVLTTQAEFSSAARSDADGRNAAIPAVLAGVNDAALLSRVYPAPAASAAAGGARLRLRAARAAWLGSRLEDHVRLVDATSCRGSLNYTSPLAGPEGGDGRRAWWPSRAARQRGCACFSPTRKGRSWATASAASVRRRSASRRESHRFRQEAVGSAPSGTRRRAACAPLCCSTATWRRVRSPAWLASAPRRGRCEWTSPGRRRPHTCRPAATSTPSRPASRG